MLSKLKWETKPTFCTVGDGSLKLVPKEVMELLSGWILQGRRDLGRGHSSNH